MFLWPYNFILGCVSLKKIKTRGKTTFQKEKKKQISRSEQCVN